MPPAPAPVDVLSGYALWAERYPARPHNPLMAAEQAAMLSLLPENLAGRRCLDAACGSGRYLRILRDRRAAITIGFDLSPHMLQQFTIHRSPFTVHHCLQSSFLRAPLPSSSVDVITCGLSIGHTPHLPAAIAELARVLLPGGLLLYSDIHPGGVRAGWQRTFTAADGRRFSLEHYRHTLPDHRRACEQAGLSLHSVLEPPLPGGSMPVVLVIGAVKTGR
ncbi:MAG: class I SAM-dependent methyltransferase [Anaerolineae bacterium]